MFRLPVVNDRLQDSDKTYLHYLLKNSRPASVSEMYATVSGNDNPQDTQGPPYIFPQKFSAALEHNRDMDAQLVEKYEHTVAAHPCLVIPSRSLEENNQAYQNPILKWEDIAQNLRINVHVMREIHGEQCLLHVMVMNQSL